MPRPNNTARGQTDARSDVYSLGVVLHRLLTLHDPGSTPFTLPAIHQFNPQVTPEMEQLVARATQIQASQRFQTMAEVRQALAGAPAPTAPATLPGSGKQPWPALLAGLLVLAVIVGAGWVFGRRVFDPPSPTPVATVAVVPTAEPTETPVPTATSTPLVAVAATQPPAPTPTLPPSTVYIEYVLDGSNSMVSSLSGSRARLDVARTALIRHWQSLPTQPNIGLRAFGHRRPAVDTASCLDTEKLVPLGQGQIEPLISTLSALTPQGMSPLATALREASGDLSPAPGRADALILVADGGDNCGENPEQMIGNQREVGLRFPIYIAGLAVDEATRQELSRIAVLTGGQYHDVANEEQLVQTLDAFVQQIEAGATR